MKTLVTESTFQKIIRITGRKPVECKCNLCKQQCQTPCLGTPEDIEKIIEAGYKDRLSISEWCVGKIMGIIDFPIPMVQSTWTDKGCAFLKDDLCLLHDKGLKPTEGKLSHHSIGFDNFHVASTLAWNVAKEWIDPKNIQTVLKIFSEIIK